MTQFDLSLPPNAENFEKLQEAITEMENNLNVARNSGNEIPYFDINEYITLLAMTGLNLEQAKARASVYKPELDANPSLPSTQEPYELPTNYKASWELEKELRIALERENKKLRGENRNLPTKIKELEAEKERLRLKLTQEELKVRRLEKAKLNDGDFIEKLKQKDTAHQIEASKKISELQKYISTLRTSRTTFLYLSIFLGVAAVAELVAIVLLLNR